MYTRADEFTEHEKCEDAICNTGHLRLTVCIRYFRLTCSPGVCMRGMASSHNFAMVVMTSSAISVSKECTLVLSCRHEACEWQHMVRIDMVLRDLQNPWLYIRGFFSPELETMILRLLNTRAFCIGLLRQSICRIY